jgi:hypothetical protein
MSNSVITLDTSAVDAFLGATPRNIFNATRSAIRTTTTFSSKLMAQKMIEGTDLPGTVFKKFRVFNKARDDQGSVFLGENPVKAEFAGKMQQEHGGASAGKYFFPHGFVATFKNGHTGLFLHVAGSRKLKTATIDLPMSPAVAEAATNATAVQLQEKFLSNLESMFPNA